MRKLTTKEALTSPYLQFSEDSGVISLLCISTVEPVEQGSNFLHIEVPKQLIGAARHPGLLILRHLWAHLGDDTRSGARSDGSGPASSGTY